jgi:hypothetical protein
MIYPPLSGCVIAADALSPQLFASFGFDPSTFQPGPGTIILVFEEEAGVALAEFVVTYGPDDVDQFPATTRIIPLSTGGTDNEVIDCPIGEIQPDQVDIITTTVEGDQVTTEEITVEYQGATLIEGRDYDCGDVVILRILPSAQADPPYVLQVEVIPGS